MGTDFGLVGLCQYIEDYVIHLSKSKSKNKRPSFFAAEIDVYIFQFIQCLKYRTFWTGQLSVHS